MPFWNYFINTKPEVDDCDLPLLKHRIYDDDGCLKPNDATAPNSQVSAATANAKKSVSAKDSTPMSPKTRAKILRSIGATPTAPRRGSKTAADANAIAAPSSPVPKSPVPKSPAPPKRQAPSISQSPTRPRSAEDTATSQKTSPKKSERSASPKKASPKRAASKRSKSSVSPKKKKQSPSRAKSPATERKSSRQRTPSRSASPKRAVSQSSASRKATSPKKSSPKSASNTPRKARSEERAGVKRGRSQSTQQDGNPSLRWTMNALRAYATEHKIDVSQGKTKAEILAQIEGHLRR